MRHLMSPLDFSVEELDKLMDLAGDIEAHPEKYAHACAGKKLATLFWLMQKVMWTSVRAKRIFCTSGNPDPDPE